MFRTRHKSPLAFGYKSCSRRPPQPEMTAIVRGRFALRPGSRVELLKKPLSMPELEADERSSEADEVIARGEYALAQGALTADVFAEDDSERRGELIYPGDFADWKPRADVMVRARCHPPNGSATSCLVEMGVGEWSKKLSVTGPRVWVDTVAGGHATEPLHFKMIPIDYRHAFGGPEVADNPVGKGHQTAELPSIERPGDHLKRAGQRVAVAGFGPINPGWPERQGKLGKKWDKDYEKTREPYYPEDFDWSHFNAAPADQQVPYLRGDETLRFVNMHPDAAEFRVSLPGIRPRVFVLRASDEVVEVKLVLDTLFADLVDGVLHLGWRGLIDVKEDDLSDVAAALVAHESLAERRSPERGHAEELRAFAADPSGFQTSPAAALQRFEEDRQSGRLAAEIDALPPDQDALTHVIGGVADKTMPPAQAAHVRAELGRAVKATANQPGDQQLIRAELKKALSRLGGGGGGLTAGGGINLGLTPVLRRTYDVLGKVRAHLAAGGVDIDDELAMVERQLADIDDPELAGARELSIPRAEGPEPEPAPGCDLSGRDLSGRDLAGVDLRGANLEGASLNGANLRGAKLAGARMGMASLGETDLGGADLSLADLALSQLLRSHFGGANLEGACLEGSFQHGADFSGARMAGVRSDRTISHEARFTKADLRGASFEFCFFGEADLDDADLSRANLRRTMFRGCKMRRARLDEADLTRGGFMKCDLGQARIRKVRGERTSFLETTLREADLRWSTLTGAIFLSVLAGGAQFAAADLAEARFYKAVLRGADFSDANLRQADMRKASVADARFKNANLYQAVLLETHGNDVDFEGANVKRANFKRNRLVMKR